MTIDAKINNAGDEVIFTDTNGDSEILNITSGGIISTPQQPLAMCWNPTSISPAVTGDSIAFANQSSFNRGITYDSDTFTFTQKGVYSVSYTISGSQSAGISVNDGIAFPLHLNDSIYEDESLYGYTSTGTVSGEEYHYTISNVLIDISVGDTLRLKAANVDTSAFSIDNGNISIVKVA